MQMCYTLCVLTFKPTASKKIPIMFKIYQVLEDFELRIIHITCTNRIICIKVYGIMKCKALGTVIFAFSMLNCKSYGPSTEQNNILFH